MSIISLDVNTLRAIANCLIMSPTAYHRFKKSCKKIHKSLFSYNEIFFEKRMLPINFETNKIWLKRLEIMINRQTPKRLDLTFVCTPSVLKRLVGKYNYSGFGHAYSYRYPSQKESHMLTLDSYYIRDDVVFTYPSKVDVLITKHGDVQLEYSCSDGVEFFMPKQLIKSKVHKLITGLSIYDPLLYRHVISEPLPRKDLLALINRVKEKATEKQLSKMPDLTEEALNKLEKQLGSFRLLTKEEVAEDDMIGVSKCPTFFSGSCSDDEILKAPQNERKRKRME